ncbi:MAG TPA: phosphatidate cytidylyltransferase [Phycisphaerae bacterium]|nr:phosphatidate cytidylyltransferase [Phycisphaerae bacterium]
MLQRFLYGFIAISAVVCVVVLDWFLATSPKTAGGTLGHLVSRGTLIPVLFAALVLGGSLEMMRLLRSVGLRPHALIAVVMCVVLMLSPWLCAAGLLGESPGDVEGLQWQLIWLGLAALVTGVAQLRRGFTDGAIGDIAATWMTILYLGLLPSFATQLRSSPDVPGSEGPWLILMFLAVTKASDVGAYLTGTAIGRRKLIPAISPGKSIEGAVGGVLVSILVAVIFHQFYFVAGAELPSDSDVLIGFEEISRPVRSLAFWQAVVFGALMSVFGQLGDLFESIFKRAAGKKDSASLLPSYGGLLDLIDSPVFAAPVAWFVLTVWWDIV